MKKQFWLMIVFVMLIVTIAEQIGRQTFTVGSMTMVVQPLVFSVVITMLLGLPFLRKGIMKKIYSQMNIRFSAKYLVYITLPLMARYGADVAPRMRDILSVGWVFAFQELGNLGTVILGLPIALLLGLKREAIGATLGLGREGELAYISEKYTLNSPEGRGILSLYLIGTLFGTIVFSVLAPVFISLGFDYRALAMSSGVGSASLMTASASSLVALYPDQESVIISYASASQLLTSFFGTYTMVFLAAPLQSWMYKFLTRRRTDEQI